MLPLQPFCICMCFRDCCWSQHLYLLNFHWLWPCIWAIEIILNFHYVPSGKCSHYQVGAIWIIDGQIFLKGQGQGHNPIFKQEKFLSSLTPSHGDQHSGCSCSTGHKALEEHKTQWLRLNTVKISIISTWILKLNAVQGQIPSSSLHTSWRADVQFYLGEHWNVLVEEEITRAERMNLLENRVWDLL